jgi:hypothetical protein
LEVILRAPIYGLAPLEICSVERDLGEQLDRRIQ